MDAKQHFNSTLEFASWYEANAHSVGGYYNNYYYSASAGLNLLKSGDDSNIERARALLSRFQETIEVEQHTWQLSVAGAFPNVPAFLAGQPETMWMRERIMDDRTPLRVWVGLTSSGGIDRANLVTRGVTLGAFAIAVSERRPVLISPYVNLGAYSYGRIGRQNALISWDIQSSPLVLSELMASLSCDRVTRDLGLAACHVLNPGVTGAWHSDYDNELLMREHLGAQPSDLYLPSIHLYDPLLTNPEQWLKDNIAKYTADSED